MGCPEAGAILRWGHRGAKTNRPPDPGTHLSLPLCSTTASHKTENAPTRLLCPAMLCCLYLQVHDDT